MEPSWVPNSVFYALNPDRFDKSAPVPGAAYDANAFEAWDDPPVHKAYKGGNLYGVLRRLDYLQDLGINAIYLTPIFTSPTHHRYKTIDHFQVDPLLGGNEAFDVLLKEAHRRSIRIVLDGVFNHVGIGFPRFQDVLEYGKASPWRQWFHTENWPEYKCWNGNRSMPALNYENPFVVEYILDVAAHWVRKGIDGWRLDAPQEIRAPRFWQRMRESLCAIRPEIYLVGEIWTDATQWLDGSQWHGVTNYPLMGAIHRFIAGPRIRTEHLLPGTPPQEPLDAAGFARQVEWLMNRYERNIQVRQLNFLGTHDTARFRALCGEDEETVELATALLMAMPGAPCIYYGDEVGMTGGVPPASRGGFPAREKWNARILNYHRELISLRKTQPALCNGTLRILIAQDQHLVLERASHEGRVIVVVNASETPARIDSGRLRRQIYGSAELAGQFLLVPRRSASFWEV